MVTVITLTGGRPEAFALCERWMSRQDYPFQWIVVDDCEPWTATGNITMHPQPPWDGKNTIWRNMLTALSRVDTDKIVIAEDDDWYSPQYVRRMAELLDDATLVGQVPTICYHVKWRAWFSYDNVDHASLSQTAFRSEEIPTLRKICEQESFIDLALYKRPAKLVQQTDVVGMKGLPGRPGVMPQHTKKDGRYKDDQDLRKLRELIGDDARFYESFGSSSS